MGSKRFATRAWSTHSLLDEDIFQTALSIALKKNFHLWIAMSDNNPGAAQNRAEANRLEWTVFSQSLCQLLRDNIFFQQSAVMCESAVINWLKKCNGRVNVLGKRKIIRVFRGKQASLFRMHTSKGD